MRFVAACLIILALAGGLLFSTAQAIGADGQAKSDPAKEKDAKAPKKEPEFNSPPKGATIISIGRLTGQITKGSDGKTFSMETVFNGSKKEIEINLAAITKVRRIKQNEFDDKGNRKTSPPVVTDATADEIRGGTMATVVVSGTRDGKWLVAKLVTLAGE
jgi:hypothetical protein